MQLIDSHCHLDFPVLAADQAALIARARAAGVWPLLTISTRIQQAAATIALAALYDEVYCTIGVHPDHVAEAGETVTAAQLAEQAEHHKVVGLGESGLDYFYNAADRGLSDAAYRARQQESFQAHLQAGILTNLPVVVHSRQAEADTARLIAEAGGGHEPRLRGVLHCFSSGRELAEAGLAMGFYVSFSGILTFKKSTELRAIAKDIPLDRLLVETDAPFLAPEPHRGATNEPAFVVHTAKVLAEVKGISLAEMAAITTENFYRLFSRL